MEGVEFECVLTGMTEWMEVEGGRGVCVVGDG